MQKHLDPWSSSEYAAMTNAVMFDVLLKDGVINSGGDTTVISGGAGAVNGEELYNCVAGGGCEIKLEALLFLPSITEIDFHKLLVQRINTVLPGLKTRISSALVSVAKEHASYGEITESKAGMGALLLNILSKYSEAFSSMIEGKNEEMSTSELSGGARIHYIFQSIFVKSLEEVDPCEDLTDDDIRTAIHNATGPRSALFVPEVPFEVLIRRQIARLLDPSLQCARFIYDELIKMSHRCMVNELQRFPVLRKRIDDVLGNFLRDGLQPSETMIGHIVEMEMDYINTSHPNFVGGSKAVEIALQQLKSSKIATTMPRQKDGVEADKVQQSEKGIKSRAILARPNGIVTEQ
ncbi:hypothetical protein M8C21_002822, partial [Ambrosia artemisiifolia]